MTLAYLAMQTTAAPEAPITLTEAKRRLADRTGMCEESLRVAGYVKRLRERGAYLSRQRTLGGGLKLRCLRLRPSVVEALADEIIGTLPTAD